MSALLGLIGNGGSVRLEETAHFAAILGEAPSKGARSPFLWNAAFRRAGVSAKMWPMDVTSEALASVVAALREDPRFLGGAVAVPYKQRMLSLLDDVEPQASLIGAVNAIYRRGNQLVGANTDGAGAYDSLTGRLGAPLEGKRALLIGTGGAGRAVATYLASGLGPQGKLYLANRTASRAAQLADALSAQCPTEAIEGVVGKAVLEEVSLVVNCSTAGMDLFRRSEAGVEYLRPYSPLGPIPSPLPEASDRREYVVSRLREIATNRSATLEALAVCRAALVFDIIYQPAKTELLSAAELVGLSTLNGEQMNLEQAVIAYLKAAQHLSAGDSAEVRESMRQAVAAR